MNMQALTLYIIPYGVYTHINGLTRADVSAIITYIRELQRVNGIN